MRIHLKRPSVALAIALLGSLHRCRWRSLLRAAETRQPIRPLRHRQRSPYDDDNGPAVLRVGPVRLLRRFLDGNVGPNGVGRHRLARRRRPDSRQPVWPGASAGVCVRRADEGDAEESSSPRAEGDERVASRLPGRSRRSGDPQQSTGSRRSFEETVLPVVGRSYLSAITTHAGQVYVFFTYDQPGKEAEMRDWFRSLLQAVSFDA